MNLWPFVIAAYAVTFLGVVGVSLWAWRAARNAEARAESLRQERD